MKDIPICIADHREVVPPSQVLETAVGMWIAWYMLLPTSALSSSACLAGKSFSMFSRNWGSMSSASSWSPVKTLT